LEFNQGYTTMHGQPVIKKAVFIFSLCPSLAVPKQETWKQNVWDRGRQFV